MWKAITLTLATMLVAAFAFLISRGLKSAAQEHTHTPFIAYIVEKHYPSQAEAADPIIDYAMFSRRSDGSEVTVYSLRSEISGQIVQPREIVDLASRMRVSLEPLTASKTTYVLSATVVGEMRRAANVCSNDPNAERGKILGYDVVRTLEETVGEDGMAERFDRWLAPRLNCYPLRESSTLHPASSSDSGPRNEREVTLILEGAPPDWMFLIPQSYRERSPSELAAEYAKRFPGHTYMHEKAAEELDDAYFAHQAGH